MNKIVFLLPAVFLFSISQINVQSVVPTDTEIIHNEKPRACIQVNLDPEPKTLKKAWKEYLEDNYDFKIKGIGFLTNKDILYKEEVTIEQVSSKAVDFYTQIIEDDNGSEMKIFARHGYDMYINKNDFPAEYKQINKMLEGFLKGYLPKYYQDMVDGTQKRIQSLTEEREDLKEEITDLSDEIEKLKEEIAGLSDDLESNKEKLEEVEKKLSKRKEKLIKIRKQLKTL